MIRNDLQSLMRLNVNKRGLRPTRNLEVLFTLLALELLISL